MEGTREAKAAPPLGLGAVRQAGQEIMRQETLRSDDGREAAESGRASRDVELVISRTLRYGVLLASALVALGLVALLFTIYTAGGPRPTITSVMALGGAESHILRSPTEVFAGLGQRDSNALVDLGLFVLMATPIAAVALSGLQFLLERDYRFAAVVVVVLGVIAASFFLGMDA